jgi:hypothetical protein
MGFLLFLKYTFIIFAAHLATSCGAPFENHWLSGLERLDFWTYFEEEGHWDYDGRDGPVTKSYSIWDDVFYRLLADPANVVLPYKLFLGNYHF